MPDDSTGAQVDRHVRKALRKARPEDHPRLFLFSWVAPFILAALVAIVPIIRSDGIEEEQVQRLMKSADDVDKKLDKLTEQLAKYEGMINVTLSTVQRVQDTQESQGQALAKLAEKQVNDRTSIRTLHTLLQIELGRKIPLPITDDK